MAASEKRRQKKIEAKRTKRKEQQKAVARIESSGMIARMMAAQRWEIIDTRISPDYVERGIGNAVIVRRGPFDQVVAVMFLVDMYCLGVKDVVIFVGAEATWKRRLADREEQGLELKHVAPEMLRKIVEGSVAYARSLGIAPHREWAQAAPIFGDIDATKCLTEVTFGKDGKPCFISGPYDRPERVRQIMAAMKSNAGEGNYNFLLTEDSMYGIDEDGEVLEDGEGEDGEGEDEDFADQWNAGKIIEIPHKTLGE